MDARVTVRMGVTSPLKANLFRAAATVLVIA